MKFNRLYKLLFEIIEISQEDWIKILYYLHSFKDHERIIVYTLLNERYEYVGDKNEVILPPERNNDSTIIFHNHTTVCGFSPRDIFNIVCLKNVTIISVVCSDKNVYQLSKTENTEKYSTDLTIIENELNNILKENLKLHKEDIKNGEYEKSLVDSYDEVHKHFAKKYELKYVKGHI